MGGCWNDGQGRASRQDRLIHLDRFDSLRAGFLLVTVLGKIIGELKSDTLTMTDQKLEGVAARVKLRFLRMRIAEHAYLQPVERVPLSSSRTILSTSNIPFDGHRRGSSHSDPNFSGSQGGKFPNLSSQAQADLGSQGVKFVNPEPREVGHPYYRIIFVSL